MSGSGQWSAISTQTIIPGAHLHFLDKGIILK